MSADIPDTDTDYLQIAADKRRAQMQITEPVPVWPEIQTVKDRWIVAGMIAATLLAWAFAIHLGYTHHILR
jgi:hypothetical protein